MKPDFINVKGEKSIVCYSNKTLPWFKLLPSCWHAGEAQGALKNYLVGFKNKTVLVIKSFQGWLNCFKWRPSFDNVDLKQACCAPICFFFPPTYFHSAPLFVLCTSYTQAWKNVCWDNMLETQICLGICVLICLGLVYIGQSEIGKDFKSAGQNFAFWYPGINMQSHLISQKVSLDFRGTVVLWSIISSVRMGKINPLTKLVA